MEAFSAAPRPTPHCVEARPVCRVPTETNGNPEAQPGELGNETGQKRARPPESTGGLGYRRLTRREYRGGSSTHRNLIRSPAVNLLDDGCDTCKVSVVAQTWVGPAKQGVAIDTGTVTSKL